MVECAVGCNPCTFQHYLSSPLPLNEGVWYVALTGVTLDFLVDVKKFVFVTIDIVEDSQCRDSVYPIVRFIDASKKELTFHSQQLQYFKCVQAAIKSFHIRIIDERGRTVRHNGTYSSFSLSFIQTNPPEEEDASKSKRVVSKHGY